MHKITLQPINESVAVRPGGAILPALVAKNLQVLMSCGGNGICSTCHVRVRDGADQLSSIEPKERRTLSLVDGADASSRLACQAHVLGDGVVLDLPAGMYVETMDDLVGLLGERAPENILHPIRGHVLIPKGKIITRTILERSRSLDSEVKLMKSGLLGTTEAPAEPANFAATGRGVAPRTSRAVEFDRSTANSSTPGPTILVSVAMPFGTPSLKDVELPRVAKFRSPNPPGVGSTRVTIESSAGWEDRVEVASETDAGMRRGSNQDSLVVVSAETPEAWRDRGHLFLVADGMGGHAAGEVASAMAADQLPMLYQARRTLPPAEALAEAYGEVGRMILDHSRAFEECHGMGTTCSTLVLLPEGAIIAHVGDSRVYRVRGGRITQLSNDHSLAGEMVRQGRLTREQVKKMVGRNVILRCLGLDRESTPEVQGPLPVAPGDGFVLCSDGLTGHVDDHEIGLFASLFEPQEAARSLVALANLRGGRDNISVIVVRVGPPLDGSEITSSEGPGEESTSCQATDAMVSHILDHVKTAWGFAVEHAWPIETSSLKRLVRQAQMARNSGDLSTSLRLVAQAIVLIGAAGRLPVDGKTILVS